MSREISSLGLANSLAKYVESQTGTLTRIRRDGMDYPKDKPFVLVTTLPSVIFGVAKAKETIQQTHSYQLDIYADTHAGAELLKHIMTDLIMFGSMTYMDDSGVITSRSISFDDNFVVSHTYAESISNKTEYHRAHVEVNITLNKHINKGDVSNGS